MHKNTSIRKLQHLQNIKISYPRIVLRGNLFSLQLWIGFLPSAVAEGNYSLRWVGGAICCSKVVLLKGQDARSMALLSN